MRRSDREITDPKEAEAILNACSCCRLGLCDGDRPYIVPLSFGWERRTDSGCSLYFHGAQEGRKMDLIRRGGTVAFEMDTGEQLHRADTACGHSTAFRCLMGEGTITILETPEEKKAALRQIMLHMTGSGDWPFEDSVVERTAVFRLDTVSLSCKAHS